MEAFDVESLRMGSPASQQERGSDLDGTVNVPQDMMFG